MNHQEVVLITGTSTGIGRLMAETCARKLAKDTRFSPPCETPLAETRLIAPTYVLWRRRKVSPLTSSNPLMAAFPRGWTVPS